MFPINSNTSSTLTLYPSRTGLKPLHTLNETQPGAFSFSGSEEDGFFTQCQCGECDDCFSESIEFYSKYFCPVCQDEGGCNVCGMTPIERAWMMDELENYPELRLVNGQFMEVA